VRDGGKPSTGRRRRNRTDAAVRRLRQIISDGIWPPGEQLPNREQLRDDLGVSMATVQNAIDQLVRDGFVHAVRAKGTFVSDQPPHLMRFLLVSSYDTTSLIKSHYYHALQETAKASGLFHPRQIRWYNHSPNDPDSMSLRRVVEEIESQRVAGVIFMNTPERELVDHPVWQRHNVPRIASSPHPIAHAHGIPRLYPDRMTLIQRGLGHLAERGCGRIGLIAHRHLDAWEARAIDRQLDDLGLQSPPWARQFPDCFGDQSVAHAVAGIMSRAPEQRPDGLLVLDEHALPALEQGLSLADMNDAVGFEIVSQCNYPRGPRSSLPVHYLGFSARELLQTALDRLEAIIRGEHVPDVTTVPPRSEAELADEIE